MHSAMHTSQLIATTANGMPWCQEKLSTRPTATETRSSSSPIPGRAEGKDENSLCTLSVCPRKRLLDSPAKAILVLPFRVMLSSACQASVWSGVHPHMRVWRNRYLLALVWVFGCTCTFALNPNLTIKELHHTHRLGAEAGCAPGWRIRACADQRRLSVDG